MKQYEDDPPVFSAGEVIKLLKTFFPHEDRPVAVRQFIEELESARKERDDAIARARKEHAAEIARATAAFDAEFLRLLGTEDGMPDDDDD